MLSMIGSVASQDKVSGYKMDTYTKALLHFDGAEGSTVFKDEANKIWTPGGTAKISKTKSKFGGSSAYFDGTSGCAISTPDSADWYLGYSDFTIDFWINLDVVAVGAEDGLVGYVMGQSDMYIGGSLNFAISTEWVKTTNSYRFNLYYGNMQQSYATYMQPNVWYHIAAVRQSPRWYMFVNGLGGMYHDAGAHQDQINCTRRVVIGNQVAPLDPPNENGFKGYIDEFRFSLGIARWVEEFTPPTF